MTNENKILHYTFIAVIGMVAMFGQITFVRLTSYLFHGNEITMCIVLGHWLFWTAIGGYLGGRLTRNISAEKFLPVLTLIYGICLLLFSHFYILIRNLIGVGNSEILGLGKIFQITFLLFFIPVTLNGMFFPTIIKWMLEKYQDVSVNFLYALEVCGAACGSLLFIIMLFKLNTLQNLTISVSFLFIISSYLFIKSKNIRRLSLVLILLLLFISIIGQEYLYRIRWKPFNMVDVVETPYQSMTVLEYNGQKTYYSDSEHLWTTKDYSIAEELVHFPLLIHNQPETILIVGFINKDILKELNRYSSIKNVTVLIEDKIAQEMLNMVEMDDLYFDLNFLFGEPFSELRKIEQKFDVIILNIPLPVNIHWNRYYTAEFFQITKEKMDQNSILSLRFPGSETYLSESQISFVKTMDNTAKMIFPTSKWIPGETIHQIISNNSFNISKELIFKKLNDLNLQTQYVQEYYLSDRLSDMKIDFFSSRIETCKIGTVNKILSPIGFFYITILWDSQTGGSFSNIYKLLYNFNFYIFLILFICIILIIFFIGRFKKSGFQHKTNMIFLGFLIMSIETVLLILYQSFVEALYFRIAILLFVFMIGAGIGAAIKTKKLESVLFYSLILLWSCLIITFLLIHFSNEKMIYMILLPIILFICGIVNGVVFPFLINEINVIEGKIISETGGKTYALDIIGACIGIYFISIIVIPIWGISSAIIFLISINSLLIIWNFIPHNKKSLRK